MNILLANFVFIPKVSRVLALLSTVSAKCLEILSSLFVTCPDCSVKYCLSFLLRRYFCSSSDIENKFSLASFVITQELTTFAVLKAANADVSWLFKPSTSTINSDFFFILISSFAIVVNSSMLFLNEAIFSRPSAFRSFSCSSGPEHCWMSWK